MIAEPAKFSHQITSEGLYSWSNSPTSWDWWMESRRDGPTVLHVDGTEQYSDETKVFVVESNGDIIIGFKRNPET